MKVLVLGAEAEVLKKEKQRDISSSSLKSSKKKHSEKWVRDSKHSFSHPWLLTSLKGHSGEVLDMDFSSNGKFLATCAEGKICPSKVLYDSQNLKNHNPSQILRVIL